MKVVEEAGVSLNESGFSNSLNCSPQSLDQDHVVDDSIEDNVQMTSFTGHSNSMGGDNENGGDSTNEPLVSELQSQNEQTSMTPTKTNISEVGTQRELKGLK